MSPANQIEHVLRDAGYRLTRPRRAVAGLIAAHRGHFTAAELEATARQRELAVSRASLFRALELLTELRLLERIAFPNGEHAYVRCASEHHHHLVCARCGRTSDVTDHGVGEAVAEIASQSGYRIDVHRLELFGLCPRCQLKTAPRAVSQ